MRTFGEDTRAALRQRVEEALARALQPWPETDLLAVRMVPGTETDVTATVAGPVEMAPATMNQLNRHLSDAIGRPTRLALRFVKIARLASRGEALGAATHGVPRPE